MFHGVGDEDYPAEAFEAHLAWLASRFAVVPLGTLVDRVEAGGPARREVALTFDDGLEQHATVVYPVLERLGIPATFFLCPGLVDDRAWLWNQEARERMKSLGRAGVGRLFGGREDYRDVLDWMERLPAPERRRAEDSIRAATPEFRDRAIRDAVHRPLTWDAASRLDPSLVTVASHSIAHPTLPTLDDAALEDEVAGSRRRLEERLGRPVDLFCYPNGAADARVRECVRRHYRAAVTTAPGFVRPGDDPYTLARIAVVPSPARMAWRLHRPTS
jgi:peptidoglycan/xylan/chitin deacetylase (PgdA/CDA1 family)